MKLDRLQARLREEALGNSGKLSLSMLLEALVPVAKLRDLAREHGLSPKGGFRLEKAPADRLVPLLVEPDNAEVFEAACKLLGEQMTRGLDAARQKKSKKATPKPPGDASEDGKDGNTAGRPALYPVLKLKEQDLEKARAELEKNRETAQSQRAKISELTRQVGQERDTILRLHKEIEELRAEMARRSQSEPVVVRDQSNRIQALEKELEEQHVIEQQQRVKLAEQAAAIRERDDRIAELEELVPASRKRKRRAEPPVAPEGFRIPHFTPSFFKSLASKDRRAVEHAYRSVFLYCTEGSRYPGLQVKPLDPSNVWSLRAARRLRVYFRPRTDGDIDVLELLDRQEQETALRRYREK